MVTKFIARMLGWLPHYELPEPFQGEVHGISYHVDTSQGCDVSIWIDLPRNRMQIEPQRFKRANRPSRGEGTTLDHIMHPLWRRGAQVIDIGVNGDKIEIIVHGDMTKVDREFAEQVAGWMWNIRTEVLGEQVPYESQRPWSKEAECSIDLDGQTVAFEFSSCLVHTKDDLAGNLDVMIRTNSNLSAEDLSDNLRLALPGFEELVDSRAYGQCDDGIAEVSFALADSGPGFGDEVREAIKSIQEVDIFWGDRREQKLATLPCNQAEE